MFIPSHIASGYLLGKGLMAKIITSGNGSHFILMVMIGAVIPDADGIFSKTVAGHHSVLHTPIFWLGFYGLILLMGKILKRKTIHPIGLGIMLGAQLHLFTDWFTARTVGIKWLYPFSNKDYSLYTIYPEKGKGTVWEMIKDPYFSFYLQNGFLLWTEISILILALVMAFQSKK